MSRRRPASCSVSSATPRTLPGTRARGSHEAITARELLEPLAAVVVRRELALDGVEFLDSRPKPLTPLGVAGPRVRKQTGQRLDECTLADDRLGDEIFEADAVDSAQVAGPIFLELFGPSPGGVVALREVCAQALRPAGVVGKAKVVGRKQLGPVVEHIARPR
jgi:hypothetical protein